MSNVNVPLVIYHAACKDGFGAAWAFSRTGIAAEYFAAQHGTLPPMDKIAGRVVYMLDFCYKRPEMETVRDKCSALHLLDHHITAMEGMEGFSVGQGSVTFDMNRSGAGLTWDVMHAGTPRPWLIDYVEDRDLWKNALPFTSEVNAYISSLPFDFSSWTEAAAMKFDTAFFQTFGKAALAKTRQYIAEVSKNALNISFEGFTVPIVNAPQTDISELLNFMANGVPFSMGWWQTADGRFKYSLRSKEGGVDVARLAQKYGGGGHVRAAGFEADTIIHKRLS